MKKITALLLAALTAVLASACGSASSETNTAAPVATATADEPADTYVTDMIMPDSLQEYLDRRLEGTEFSGVVLMTQNGETLCEAARGIENSGTKEPITTDSLFCVGSVSKQFTAAAVLLLQQDGALSVDDPLSKYYPDCEYANKLKLLHLLSMRSGIAEFYDVEYIDGIFTELPTGSLSKTVTNENTAEKNRDLLEEWLLSQPLVFEPDTDYEYSNSNFFLLARIVEQVSGQSFESFVRERIFEPIGMTHSGFIDENELSDIEHLAAPTGMPKTVYKGVTMGLGDIITNARDIDLWLTALRTNAVLSPESTQMMTTNRTLDGEDYAFGIHNDDYGWHHSGFFTTYQAFVCTVPETGLNLFTVTNDDPVSNVIASEIGWDLLEMQSLYS